MGYSIVVLSGRQPATYIYADGRSSDDVNAFVKATVISRVLLREQLPVVIHGTVGCDLVSWKPGRTPFLPRICSRTEDRRLPSSPPFCGGRSTPPVASRCGSMLRSISADSRSSDDVIASEGGSSLVVGRSKIPFSNR